MFSLFKQRVNEGKEFWINKKYISKGQQGGTPRNNQTKKVKGISRVIDGQFRFHYDIIIIKKHPNIIHPNDLISITEKKIHTNLRFLDKEGKELDKGESNIEDEN